MNFVYKTPKSPGIAVHTLPAMARRGYWRLVHPHARPEHRFFWVTRGQGRFEIGAASRGFGPNSILFAPAGQVHALRPGANAQGFAAFLPADLPAPAAPAGPMLIKAGSIFDQGQLTGYFEQMLVEFNEARTGSAEALEAYFTLLAVWMRRNRARDDWAAPRPDAAARLASRFLDLLESDHGHGLSVRDYARRLSVTPTHLNRTCRAVLGLSAGQCVQRRDIQAARYLLADSNERIGRIGAMLGFRSAAYFTRAFRRQTGQSPREFRAGAQGTRALPRLSRPFPGIGK